MKKTGTLLDVIRVETAISRYPIHCLAKGGEVEILIRNGKVRWEVSYNTKYGQPGPLGYKIDTCYINRKLEEAGRPIPPMVALGSLREIAEALDLGGDTSTVKRALLANAFAAITAKISFKDADHTIHTMEIADTRYAVVFHGQRLPDGRKADGVYLILHEFYRSILDKVLTRPLDYDYLCDLPPASRRLYELLSYQVYGALKRGQETARLAYSELCTYAPMSRYLDYERVKRQLYKLHLPHRKSGYIACVTCEASKDEEGRPDWMIVYTIGAKARSEYEAFQAKPGQGRGEAPAPEVEPAALVAELVENGVTPARARKLVEEHPEEHIKAQIQSVRTKKGVRKRGPYLATAIEHGHEVGETQGVLPLRPHVETEAEAKEAQERTDAKRRQRAIDAHRRKLSESEREALTAEALASLPSDQRAEIETAAGPVKTLLLAGALNDHIAVRVLKLS